RDRGHHVEIFTTCTRSEGRWSNELPEGTSDGDGMLLHRFRIDPHDRDRHLESVRKVLQRCWEDEALRKREALREGEAGYAGVPASPSCQTFPPEVEEE